MRRERWVSSHGGSNGSKGKGSLRIVTIVIILFYVQGGELDPLVRKPFFQFVETHELVKFIDRLKLQLLDVNVRLAVAHVTLSRRA